MGLVLYPFFYKAFYSMINIMKILKIAKFKLKNLDVLPVTLLLGFEPKSPVLLTHYPLCYYQDSNLDFLL